MRYSQYQNKENFKSALYLATAQGYDPKLLITQAYLETGIFTSSLCDVFNYFGLKIGSRWKVSIDKKTFEYDGDGKQYDIVAGKDNELGFCAFGTQYTGIGFYLMQIKRLYPNAYNNRTDYKEYYKGLTNGEFQWSTSKEYANDLIKLYERLDKENDFKEYLNG